MVEGLGLPLAAERGVGFLWSLGVGDVTGDLSIDEALGGVLGKAEFFEDWENGFDGFGVEGVAIRGFEVGVGFGDLGLDRKSTHV